MLLSEYEITSLLEATHTFYKLSPSDFVIWYLLQAITVLHQSYFGDVTWKRVIVTALK